MDNTINLYLGDNLKTLKNLPDNSVDSIVTDPPYGLSFMNKKWDYDVPSVELWKECYRVLKHGGHVLSFGGTRTYHRMVVNIEDAGFEIRDQIMWIYGSGFPKSHNIGKAVDKIEGNEREVVGEYKVSSDFSKHNGSMMSINNTDEGANNSTTLNQTKGQSKYEGWGTALKPANEPICVARKPLSEKTVAENVLKWGTGGINIDGTRVGTEVMKEQIRDNDGGMFMNKNKVVLSEHEGRFPANVILDEEAGKLLDEQSGISKSTKAIANRKSYQGSSYQMVRVNGVQEGFSDKGGASRFFYCAKASKKDRDEGLNNFEKNKSGSLNFRNPSLSGRSEDALSVEKMGGITQSRANFHPTVKPNDLMRYLCRLVTPKNGIVLDPYMGSGSTGKGAILEGFSFVGMELDDEYFNIAKTRIEDADKKYKDSQKQLKAL
jgi:DNA modification methylase